MAKNNGNKSEEKRVRGGLELINERQETMFDTELSSAADDYTKAVKETALWKDKLKSSGKALIESMKRCKITTLTVGQSMIIKYKYTDAKETVTLKDYKPAKRRRRI